MSKLLVVIGATGNQGGAVLNSFLSDKSFRLRGVTRNVDSDAARKWSEKGVEMVKADIEDEASLEAAFQVVQLEHHSSKTPP